MNKEAHDGNKNAGNAIAAKDLEEKLASGSEETPVKVKIWTPETSPSTATPTVAAAAIDTTLPGKTKPKKAHVIANPPAAAAAAAGVKDASRQQPANQEDDGLVRQEKESIMGKKLSPADFEFTTELGVGSFSRVVLATRNETNEVYAVKIMSKRLIIREKKEANVKMERDVMNFLSHPNIIQLHCTFQDSTFLYMAFEYAPGGELFSLLQELGSFSEALGQFYAGELVNALEYMHGQKIIHRDVKPENVLISANRHLKLSDFGTATFIGHSMSDQFCGTAEYVSPEVLESQKACFSSDLWALGCIIFQFFSGRVPFRGDSQYLTFQLVLALDYSFPLKFPENAKDCVLKLLVADKTQRLGARGSDGTDYPALKSHPFFKGLPFETLDTCPVPPATSYLDKSEMQGSKMAILAPNDEIAVSAAAEHPRVQRNSKSKHRKCTMQ